MQIILVFLASLLWGVTNPLLRKASFGIESVQSENRSFIGNIFHQLKFLVYNLNVRVDFN